MGSLNKFGSFRSFLLCSEIVASYFQIQLGLFSFFLPLFKYKEKKREDKYFHSESEAGQHVEEGDGRGREGMYTASPLGLGKKE